MYDIQVAVRVTTRSDVYEGFLDLQMKFVPDPNVSLTSLHVDEPLIVECVLYDVQQQKFQVWVHPVESDRKTESVLGKFAGNWDWEYVGKTPRKPVEPPAKPDVQSRGEIGKEAHDAILKILEGRARDLPRNPRETEKN